MRQISLENLLFDTQAFGVIQLLSLPKCEGTFREFVKDNPDPHTLVSSLLDFDALLLELHLGGGLDSIHGTKAALFYGDEMQGDTTLVFTKGGNLF